mmetsp:Transcript_45737/g.114477  ORF Transcript_45737/g.114477 Transcript_45737/m.114477 type:complete len:260 (+) Transcript_45737:408-1187(+)
MPLHPDSSRKRHRSITTLERICCESGEVQVSVLHGPTRKGNSKGVRAPSSSKLSLLLRKSWGFVGNTRSTPRIRSVVWAGDVANSFRATFTSPLYDSPGRPGPHSSGACQPATDAIATLKLAIMARSNKLSRRALVPSGGGGNPWKRPSRSAVRHSPPPPALPATRPPSLVTARQPILKRGCVIRRGGASRGSPAAAAGAEGLQVARRVAKVASHSILAVALRTRACLGSPLSSAAPGVLPRRSVARPRGGQARYSLDS